MLKETNVVLDISAESKETLFKYISHHALETGIVADADAFVAGLVAREDFGSTGFMDGFAIPHCKSTTVVEPTVFFIRLEKGIDWGLADDTLARFLFCMAIPESDGGEQLKLLSQLSRKLVHKDFRSQLQQAQSPQDVANIVNQAIG